MYTIGVLSLIDLKENSHFKFLTEKGWATKEIMKKGVFNVDSKIRAIVIEESSMPKTCCQLIELKKSTINRDIPMYILSKKNSEYNKVYLQLGVEACFSIEIDPDEFCSTLTNLLNRCYSVTSQITKEKFENKSYLSNNIELILENRSVLIGGQKEVGLTNIEFKILYVLNDNANKTVCYADLIEKVWTIEQNKNELKYKVANVVFHLRNKIEKNPKSPVFIKTVRSRGYMLCLD
ncbi:response regulator transcription factor [Enterococcus sp. AZ136]|uniref:response regulator transcription factor n=1 Tax=Enterococcus sp. AZ136 TaxID=2774788 RepID=UPI003D29E78D